MQLPIYEKALRTEGYFTEAEGKFLMQNVTQSPAHARMLEIGAYHGRSTLFALSVLGENQCWFVVDNFRNIANCKGHRFAKLLQEVSDPRVMILPGTLEEMTQHLSDWQFDLIFIDADHSFRGFSQDIALAISLALPGGTLLCHDVCDMFPGVVVALGALQHAGVIEPQAIVHSLKKFRIRRRPTWLTHSSVFRGEEL